VNDQNSPAQRIAELLRSARAADAAGHESEIDTDHFKRAAETLDLSWNFLRQCHALPVLDETEEQDQEQQHDLTTAS
jgi:hypothetical protein